MYETGCYLFAFQVILVHIENLLAKVMELGIKDLRLEIGKVCCLLFRVCGMDVCGLGLRNYRFRIKDLGFVIYVSFRESCVDS
jgi:hypothetical protein